MRIRLGHTIGGNPVHLDSQNPRIHALIGDTGTGKTTTARFISRWWSANHPRSVCVLAAHPEHWADLADILAGLGTLSNQEAPTQTPRGLQRTDMAPFLGAHGLTVLDGVETLELRRLRLLVTSLSPEHTRPATV